MCLSHQSNNRNTAKAQHPKHIIQQTLYISAGWIMMGEVSGYVLLKNSPSPNTAKGDTIINPVKLCYITTKMSLSCVANIR